MRENWTRIGGSGNLGCGLKPMMQRLPAFFDYASDFKKRSKNFFLDLFSY
jgi:hypothetical protein